MCKSDLKNGVCREYGVYCAKAHKPTEIRNLVKIYGENWKKHYDLSLRGKAGTLSIVKARGKCIKKSYTKQSKRQSTGMFFSDNLPEKPNGRCSDQPEARGSTKTSSTLMNSRTVIDPQSPMLCASPPLFGDYCSICDSMSDLSLDGAVTSYAQLYSDKVTMVDNSYKSPIPNVQWDCPWYSPGTDVPPMEASSVSSSNSIFMSPFGENWKKCNSSDVWKIDASEWDKENWPSNMYEDNTESLFAQPPYEGNWNKNFLDPRPEPSKART